MGEPNIPIDKTVMHTDAFHDLLGRLRKHAEEHYRDHWCVRVPLQSAVWATCTQQNKSMATESMPLLRR